MTRTTPELSLPSPNFRITPVGGRLTYYLRFNVQQVPYTADLQLNWVSNLEHTGPEAEDLPLGLRGLLNFMEVVNNGEFP
ncbi:hypothetical protein AVEN_271352-1 [Araneus ventricosus]|uniref:Uncharacterized protein n=1 Tax=Araneus ventricosus TaxID=182803 RepID=A0A4Y2VPL4_ARAVE|nr:hypothetical protein AVEN_271352-1 [Araneus ventricosus]